MPTLNQAAYVSESLGMRKAKRLGSDERIIYPRAPGSRKADEIVCSARKKNLQKPRIKSHGDNTWTTIQSRSGELADNLTNNNAMLRRLKARGNVRPFSGGNVILEEIMYNDPATDNSASYSGYEAINISPDSPISAAQYSIKQYADAVPDVPTTGTYGGIDRATWTFWQPKKFSGVTDGGAAVSVANIQQYMTKLALQLVRGTDMPDLIVADTNYYALYANSLQAIQRVTSDGGGDAGAGFASLKFYGGGTQADVVLDGGIGAAAT